MKVLIEIILLLSLVANFSLTLTIKRDPPYALMSTCVLEKITASQGEALTVELKYQTGTGYVWVVYKVGPNLQASLVTSTQNTDRLGGEATATFSIECKVEVGEVAS